MGEVKKDYIPVSEAAKILDLTTETVRKMGLRKALGIRKIPGVNRTWYSRADVERLAQEAIRPAAS